MLNKITLKIIAGLLLVLASTGYCLAQQTISHKVESGETLFGIAEQYNVSVAQIKQWNNLSGNNLSVGQTLVIRQSQNDQESATIHTVQPQETLYSISRQYGVGINELKQWNNLQGENLNVGTELKIYPNQNTKNPSATNSGGQSTYTVKSGDSLFRIAKIHDMTVQRLKELNNLTSNNIQVGQQLAVIPTDQPPSLAVAGVESSSQGNFVRYTVEESQSKQDLLEKFKMDAEEFEALNPGLSQTSFRKGDQLNILVPANQSYKNPYTVNSSMTEIGTARPLKYDKASAEPTTSGELYNPEGLTGAHPNIAMGSVIFVQNPENQRGVFIRINDRTTQNGLKLSDAAWEALALTTTSDRLILYRHNE